MKHRKTAAAAVAALPDVLNGKRAEPRWSAAPFPRARNERRGAASAAPTWSAPLVRDVAPLPLAYPGGCWSVAGGDLLSVSRLPP